MDSLKTQGQIDSFSINHPGCTVVGEPGLIISGQNITNLNGLNGITTVTGALNIVSCPALTNLNGLSGLSTVNGVISILNDGALVNLDGLQNHFAVAIITIIVWQIPLIYLCPRQPSTSTPIPNTPSAQPSPLDRSNSATSTSAPSPYPSRNSPMTTGQYA